MKEVLKNIFTYVFSFAGFVSASFIIIMFLMGRVASIDYEQNAKCYEQGMIRVNTAGGHYCVQPNVLVAIK